MKVLKDPSFQLSISLLYIPRRGTLWLKYDILRAFEVCYKTALKKGYMCLSSHQEWVWEVSFLGQPLSCHEFISVGSWQNINSMELGGIWKKKFSREVGTILWPTMSHKCGPSFLPMLLWGAGSVRALCGMLMLSGICYIFTGVWCGSRRKWMRPIVFIRYTMRK